MTWAVDLGEWAAVVARVRAVVCVWAVYREPPAHHTTTWAIDHVKQPTTYSGVSEQ